MKQFINICFYIISGLSIYACHESNNTTSSKNTGRIISYDNNRSVSHFLEFTNLHWVNYSKNNYRLSLDLPKGAKEITLDDLANIYMVNRNGYLLETTPILSDYKFDLELSNNKLILYYHTISDKLPPKPEKIKVELFM